MNQVFFVFLQENAGFCQNSNNVVCSFDGANGPKAKVLSTNKKKKTDWLTGALTITDLMRRHNNKPRLIVIPNREQ